MPVIRPSGQPNLNGVDDELHDLKLRFELLEGDRKAYYETSQWAIRQNKDEVGHLRQENKELSEAIAKIKKHEIESQTFRASMSELEKFNHRVCEIHRKYDELQAEARAKEEKLSEMRDQLADLQRESELVESNLQDSPQAKEIRMLENRLDKAMIKYNEAQSIRKTYEHIVKRLQDERLTFDNQLATFEKTLKAKKQDSLELEMMSRDANHAKEVARAEHARFEQQINEERKQRDRDLQVRKELVKQKMEVIDKLERKSLQVDDQNADSSQQSDAHKEAYDEAKERKMGEYEETMRLIKEATGVSDINEVIAKFQSQGDTHNHLTQLQLHNETRVNDLKQKKLEIESEYEQLKTNGESKMTHSQRLMEEFEKHLKETQAHTDETRHKFERIAKLLNNTKAGVQHLCDKLETISLVEKTPKLSMSDENVKPILEICISKLEHLTVTLEGKEMPEPIQPTAAQLQQQGEPPSILQVNPSVLPAFNTRVKLRPVEFEQDLADEEDENDDDGGEEVPDRESIKKHTNQMINARLKKNQPKKSKKKKVKEDMDD
ncbi:hypothetical protein HK100_008836 [Physocladia obscura]|uniref:ODAD1 central coiled coil region domain-containing protein n=1 Tax=Physocladia obscura TaxID=109957 RepID=A0AAD5XJK1_9FUNG|nr:hypothetical protein HK100_008836 [Physocladia obscura]